MSFRLNTNVDALTAYYNLLDVNDEISLSIKRLSSGLRVSSPADDPAKFVIANNYEVQVDGLNQAISNIQNSSTLTKTATGALSQINTLLSSIRAAALDAAANITINPAAAQNAQYTIQAALQSINSIAATTEFGNKNLLDGSAGISAAVTNSTTVGGITFGGSYGGGVTQAGNVTITVNNAATVARAYNQTAATYASVSATLATVNGTTTGTGGYVTINGQTITSSGSDTVQTLIDRINALSSSTGVTANFSSADGSGSIALTQTHYGANYQISVSETSPLTIGTSGTLVSGLNATVTVTAQTRIDGTVSAVSTTFVGGRYSTDSGLRVTDTSGNSILLTEAGNTTATTSQAVGSITSNALQFQIGANLSQTVSVTFPNVFPSQLGATSVPGETLSTINVTTLTGANNAVLIANEAIDQIGQYQAQLGSFQKHVLQSSLNVLSNTVENLSASIASIRNVDIAEETTRLTNLQAIQQAGIVALRSVQSRAAVYLQLLS